MPKGTLTFKLPEEQEEFTDAQRAGTFRSVIEDIGNQVFRPARKHGYPEPEINKILESSNEARLLVSMLEDKYWALLRDNGLIDM